MTRQKFVFEIALLLIVCVALIVSASAQDQQQGQTTSQQQGQTMTTLSTRDRDFMMKAAQTNMLLEQLAGLADMNAQSEQVKDLARHVRDEAKDANDKLKELASKSNITLPQSLDKEHQRIYNSLASLSGSLFDKAFAQTQLQLHDQAVQLFQDESQNGQNREVRDFASSSLDPLKRHQQEARILEQNLGTATAANIPFSKQQPEQQQRSKPAQRQALPAVRKPNNARYRKPGVPGLGSIRLQGLTLEGV
jgi:putative membrane protein